MAQIRYLVVHHAAAPRSTSRETIRRWHVEQNGWRDIGYQALLRQVTDDDLVTVIPGRDHDWDERLERWEYGAHVRGSNHKSIGICCIGNFSREQLPDRMRSVLIDLLAELCVRWELDATEAVRGHREMPGAATECPGLLIDLDALREAVAIRVIEVERLAALLGERRIKDNEEAQVS